MSSPEKPGGYDTAVVAFGAFEIRFERELDSSWRDLAGKTREAIVGEGLEIDANPVEKYHLLSQFCDDASDVIAAVVNKYFPSLLEVATAQRDHLGGPSPLSWTEAKILTLVCNFLAMDEKFDETSTPRDNSRVLGAAERIITGGKYLDDGPSPEFCLPGWANRTPAQLLRSLRRDSPPGNITEPPMSRPDTLAWVKRKELWIRNRLERQISDTSLEASLDGMIEAGKTGSVSRAVPSPHVAPIDTDQNEVINDKSALAIRSAPTLNWSDEERVRAGVMFLAIEMGLEGLDYCSFLYEHGVCPSQSWIDKEGCLDTYPKAYQKSEKWRIRIRKEKSRKATLRDELEHGHHHELERIRNLANQDHPGLRDVSLNRRGLRPGPARPS
jgi:hypothetical protein